MSATDVVKEFLVPLIAKVAAATSIDPHWVYWVGAFGSLLIAGIAVWSLLSAKKAYKDSNDKAQKTIVEMRTATMSANKDAQETIREMREANKIAIKIAETLYYERFKDKNIVELAVIFKSNNNLGMLLGKTSSDGDVLDALEDVFSKIAEALVFSMNFPLTATYYIDLYTDVRFNTNSKFDPDYFQVELYKDILLFSNQHPLLLHKRKTLEEHMIYRLKDARYPGFVDDLASLEKEMNRLRERRTYLLDPKDIYSPSTPPEE